MFTNFYIFTYQLYPASEKHFQTLFTLYSNFVSIQPDSILFKGNILFFSQGNIIAFYLDIIIHLKCKSIYIQIYIKILMSAIYLLK